MLSVYQYNEQIKSVTYRYRKDTTVGFQIIRYAYSLIILSRWVLERYIHERDQISEMNSSGAEESKNLADTEKKIGTDTQSITRQDARKIDESNIIQ